MISRGRAEANERHGIANLDSPLRHCYEQKYEHIAVYAAPNRAYGHVGSVRLPIREGRKRPPKKKNVAHQAGKKAGAN